MENKFTRFDESIHHPKERCIGQGRTGDLCPYLKADGTDYCVRHAANKQRISREKQELENYRLVKYKARVGELTNSSGIKSLREEIGILRMTLENILNQCGNDTELLLYSSKIADLCMKIDKLVTSCDRLENRMGMLLDKTSILAIAEQFIDLISEYIQDERELEIVSERVAQDIICIN